MGEGDAVFSARVLECAKGWLEHWPPECLRAVLGDAAPPSRSHDGAEADADELACAVSDEVDGAVSDAGDGAVDGDAYGDAVDAEFEDLERELEEAQDARAVAEQV